MYFNMFLYAALALVLFFGAVSHFIKKKRQSKVPVAQKAFLLGQHTGQRLRLNLAAFKAARDLTAAMSKHISDGK